MIDQNRDGFICKDDLKEMFQQTGLYISIQLKKLFVGFVVLLMKDDKVIQTI